MQGANSLPYRDQDTDQARGTPVPARFTVPKMIQWPGQGPDLGQNGPGHDPDPELGQGQVSVTNSVNHKSHYQTLDCTMLLHSYSALNLNRYRPGTIGTPSAPVRRGSHFPFAPPQTKGPGPCYLSGTYENRTRIRTWVQLSA
jgi:hypothetical protein